MEVNLFYKESKSTKNVFWERGGGRSEGGGAGGVRGGGETSVSELFLQKI